MGVGGLLGLNLINSNNNPARSEYEVLLWTSYRLVPGLIYRQETFLPTLRYHYRALGSDSVSGIELGMRWTGPPATSLARLFNWHPTVKSFPRYADAGLYYLFDTGGNLSNVTLLTLTWGLHFDISSLFPMFPSLQFILNGNLEYFKYSTLNNDSRAFQMDIGGGLNWLL